MYICKRVGTSMLHIQLNARIVYPSNGAAISQQTKIVSVTTTRL